MKLSKETIERIEKEAKEYAANFYKTNGALYGMPQSIIKDAHYLAALHFSKGATAEATRYEQERKELVEENERLKVEIKSILKAVADGENLFDKIKEWT